MKALTAGYYSRKASDYRAYEEAMDTYSSAIESVWKAVDCRRLGTDTLMSIMCLCLYENIIVTEPRAWIIHYTVLSHMVNELCLRFCCFY